MLLSFILFYLLILLFSVYITFLYLNKTFIISSITVYLKTNFFLFGLVVLFIYFFFVLFFINFILLNTEISLSSSLPPLLYIYENKYSYILTNSVLYTHPVVTILPFYFTIGFITFLSIVFLLYYDFQKLKTFFFLSFGVFIISLGLILSQKFWLFVFWYELLALPSFLLLYNFGKTRKSVEAAYLMFFWTQFGALFILFNFIYLYFTLNVTTFAQLLNINITNFEVIFLSFFFFIGFGVKFPIWPFYDWLPKAHVEASTNFSIFLSGVLVKLAFFSFFKVTFFLPINSSIAYFTPWLYIGIIRATMSLYCQVDLKKIVALITVLEMHWLTLSLLFNNSYFWYVTTSMVVAHALISTVFFFLVDAVARRFKTRLWTEIRGLAVLTPNLYQLILLAVIVFLGFPGTLLFISEFLLFLLSLDLGFLSLFILMLLTHFISSSIFFKHWFITLFSNPTVYNSKYVQICDVTVFELLIVFGIISLLFFLPCSELFYFYY